MSQFLPIDGVAERYATSKHSIYRWIRDDRGFPMPIQLPSGVKRWAVADLVAWETSSRAERADFR
ncbi:helix-turn-helix transcriptional regulator [Novosphingopyxis iocasae]|uniref:helix-turn-helix transcriptional regulator n=1 Tax=Novosphingopyxis iocasae TaxID=2762729 RepID=UPI0016517FED|nr:AlpA family phage regulatory protein [Novosphingopyxis iocasae]